MGIDYKKLANDIKSSISAEDVRNKIVSDLGLIEKNKKYVCHMHSDDTKNPNMAFDGTRKDFHCFRCGGHYNILDHYMQYRNMGCSEALKAINSDFALGYDIEDTQKAPRKPVIKHESVSNKVLDYLYARKISLNVATKTGLKMDNGNIVFEYYDEHGNHEANKYRPARKFAKGETKKYWWDGSTDALFNMQNIDVTKPLVICEGEFDCCALVEAGYSNVVSPKAGAKSYEWIDKNWEWLQQFDSITLWYDNDSAGKEGAATISARLDNCDKIVYQTIAKDINEILVRNGKEEVLKVLASAKLIDVDGILRMSQIENFNVYEAEKVKTGIKVLDACIMGFVFGTLDIITGHNGSGKSTLINQMCIAESVSQGYKTFCFSGELTPSNFKYWLYSTIANKDDLLESYNYNHDKYYKLSNLGDKKITEWLDDKVFLYDKMDFSAAALLATMDKLAKRNGVRVFVIDNLMKIELDSNEKNELTAQKKFVNALKMFAIKYNAVIHLVAHPRKPQEGSKLTKYDVSGTADITNLADYVIGIHRATQEEKEEYEAYMANGGKKPVINPKDGSVTLFKDRPTGNSDKEAQMYFNKDRRRFYFAESDLDKNYGYGIEVQCEIDEPMPF